MNGVTFNATGATGYVGPDMSFSGFGTNLYNTFAGTGYQPWSSTSTAYQELLQGNSYGSNATATLSGLTSGHQYAMQFWEDDSRDCCIGRSENLNGGGNTTTVNFNNPSTGAARWGNIPWVFSRPIRLASNLPSPVTPILADRVRLR